MINGSAIEEVIEVYKKHGWALRRVLLSPNLGELGNEFGGAEIRESDLEAMWFSRSSRPGREAWELRALVSTPFALLEVVPEETSREDREALLAEVEDRMREMLVRGTTKNN